MHLEWVKSIVRVELATSPLSPLLFSCNFLFNKFLNAPFLMSRFFLNQNHNVIYMFRASHVNSKRAQVGFNIFIVRSNHDEGRPLRLLLGMWKVDQPSLPLHGVHVKNLCSSGRQFHGAVSINFCGVLF